MSTVDILEPVLAGGIRNTSFFNGRLLAAEDLTDLQTANVQQHRQLGRILGEGVAYGLQVSVAASSTTVQPVLHVTQGLALNRKGEAVALPTDVDLALVRQADAENAEAGLFAVCQPHDTILTNPGLYVLTVMPASGFSKESAPKTEVASEGFGSSCGSRYAIEGATFRVIQLNLGPTPDPATLAGQVVQLAAQLDPLLAQFAIASGVAKDQLAAQIAPLRSKFRNCAAHLCFGTEKLAGLPADPFGRTNGDSLFAAYGALDDLRAQGALTECEVPLALLSWTSAGLQFVDAWAVRRPVFAAAASSPWSPFAGQRRATDGLAIFLQFQTQVDELIRSSGGPSLLSIYADGYFRYLPATGLLPLASQSAAGFDHAQFFRNRTYRGPVFTREAKFDPLLSRSLHYPPVDLSEKELIWLYLVPSNSKLGNQPGGLPYVMFANGHISYQGNSRYDLSEWNFSNYSLVGGGEAAS